MNTMIGATIVSVSVSGDRETITLATSDGRVIVGRAYGDCCSRTWIENVENEEALVGHTIDAVEDIPMPDLGNVGTDHQPDVESVAYYGLRITTGAGICTIDYRNDSNGYYGGDLSWATLEGEKS